MSKTREEAVALLHEFTQSDALRKHARGVEEAMRAYARWYGVTDPAGIEKWGMVGHMAGHQTPGTSLYRTRSP